MQAYLESCKLYGFTLSGGHCGRSSGGQFAKVAVELDAAVMNIGEPDGQGC